MAARRRRRKRIKTIDGKPTIVFQEGAANTNKPRWLPQLVRELTKEEQKTRREFVDSVMKRMEEAGAFKAFDEDVKRSKKRRRKKK